MSCAMTAMIALRLESGKMTGFTYQSLGIGGCTENNGTAVGSLNGQRRRLKEIFASNNLDLLANLQGLLRVVSKLYSMPRQSPFCQHRVSTERRHVTSRALSCALLHVPRYQSRFSSLLGKRYSGCGKNTSRTAAGLRIGCHSGFADLLS